MVWPYKVIATAAKITTAAPAMPAVNTSGHRILQPSKFDTLLPLHPSNNADGKHGPQDHEAC
jgi:hypothetical protein